MPPREPGFHANPGVDVVVVEQRPTALSPRGEAGSATTCDLSTRRLPALVAIAGQTERRDGTPCAHCHDATSSSRRRSTDRLAHKLIEDTALHKQTSAWSAEAERLQCERHTIVHSVEKGGGENPPL